MRRRRPLPNLNGMDTLDPRDVDLRKDLDATLQARRDLGEDYDAERGGPLLRPVGRGHPLEPRRGPKLDSVGDLAGIEISC